ncbi:MAG: efflux RND transporter periplasmic adaptor subunit [bacterium]|nr:efflux RND transporter periplasmic adaptor subunit [bacterium]
MVFVCRPKSWRSQGEARGAVMLGAFWLGLALMLMGGCSPNKAGSTDLPPAQPAVPVVLGNVIQKTVPIEVHNIGTVQPNATVTVKSQVEGVIVRAAVQDGQAVKRGDLLFEIDPRPFEAALRAAEAELQRQVALKSQAEANRSRDVVQSDHADREVERNRKLFETGVISKDEFDTLRATADQYHAAVRADEAAIVSAERAIQADQAAIDAARLQLSYCTITSPIDGRLGAILVDQGNLVKANADTGMVIINQIRPIKVSFTLPEQYLDPIREAMRKGPVAVTVRHAAGDHVGKEAGSSAAADPEAPIVGRLNFINNQTDPATGTIQFDVLFPNEDERLWPGQYVEVSLAIAVVPGAVLAPVAAIQSGQTGSYCFVVKEGNSVELRRVTVGETVGDRVIVNEGLKPGEQVVVDGQLRLVDGSRIVEKKTLEGGVAAVGTTLSPSRMTAATKAPKSGAPGGRASEGARP